MKRGVCKILVFVIALVLFDAQCCLCFASSQSEIDIAALKDEIQQQMTIIQSLENKVDTLENQQKIQTINAKPAPIPDSFSTDRGAAQNYETPPSAAVAAWTGAYAGANVGLGMSNGSIVEDEQGAASYFTKTLLQGGLHGGYNYQLNNAVFGVETEGNIGNQEYRGVRQGIGFTQSVKSEIDKSAAILARTGIAIGSSLLFVDAGPAIAHLNGNGQDQSYAPVRFSVDSWVPGIKAGVGAEFLISPEISLRTQYSILQLADRTSSPAICGTPSCDDTWTNMQQAITVGADWHFW